MAGDTVIRFGKAKIEIRGLSALLKRLERMGEDAQKVAVDVFANGTQRVYTRSQSEVPVKEGHLKASGRISKPRVNKKTGVVTASVNYGGSRLKRLAPNEPEIYGIVVHEDPTGPGFKFLERPAMAEKRSVMIALERQIAAKMERG